MGRRGKGGPIDSFGAWQTSLGNIGAVLVNNIAFLIMTSYPAISMLESVNKIFRRLPLIRRWK